MYFTRQINKEDNRYPFLGSHHPLALGAAGWWDLLIASPVPAKKNAGGSIPQKESAGDRTPQKGYLMSGRYRSCAAR
jgi:hypothetical protein